MNTATTTLEQGFENAYYILNSDNKIELHLDGKNAYTSLSETAKQNIKRAFIWGRQRGAWVSRSKDGGRPYSMKDYNIPLNRWVTTRKDPIFGWQTESLSLQDVLARSGMDKSGCRGTRFYADHLGRRSESTGIFHKSTDTLLRGVGRWR